jgi:hypothetical protein
MAAGGRLDPAIRREYEQAVRSAQSARGRGFGPIDVYEEAFTVGQAAEARRAMAQNAMSQVLGLRAGLDPDVAAMILGRSSATAGNPQFALQAVGQAGSQRAYDPFNAGDYSDLYSSNANAINAANIASANSSGAQGGAMTSGGMGLIGSYISSQKK